MEDKTVAPRENRVDGRGATVLFLLFFDFEIRLLLLTITQWTKNMNTIIICNLLNSIIHVTLNIKFKLNIKLKMQA